MPLDQVHHAPTIDAVRELSEGTAQISVDLLDDEMALALLRFPRLRLIYKGNSSITDVGVRTLRGLTELEVLDLEWSDYITDASLEAIAAMASLRYVDISFCRWITDLGVVRLRVARPELQVER